VKILKEKYAEGEMWKGKYRLLKQEIGEMKGQFENYKKTFLQEVE
jgi:hypothetical protein